MKPKNEKLLAETFELTSYILVEVKLPSDQTNSAHDPSLKNEKLHRFSISALILPTKEPIFLTIGSFMYSFLTEEEKIELNNKEHLSLNNKNLKSNVRFFLHYNPKTFRHSTDQGKYIEIQPDYLLFPKDIARSFAEIFQFKTKSPLDSLTSDSDYNINRLISHDAKHFCLLTLRPVSPDSLSSTPKEYQLLNISDHPFEGQSVITISSPFALASSRLYKNTLHVSHISKIAFKTSRKLFGPSRKGCIFLVNNLLKGNDEGSPVFNEHYEVIGLVLGSISPYKNDTISFSVCLASFPIMNLLFKITSYQKGNNIWKLAVSTFRPFIKVSPIKGVLPRVVKIMGGSTTGSGVLLHPKGYILTNRHVLKSDDGQKDFTVEISYDGQTDIETYNAEIVKISKGDLDIALLRITATLSDKALKMLRSTQRFVDHSIDVRYLQGHDIYAVGYTFSEIQTIDFRVMTTKGYLSKVIVHQNTPFLLLTSCPVYNGFSGGAIISNRGEFLGLTTYNFTHSARGILNDLNFSYCSNIFKELQEAMEEKDEKNLRELDIWSLEDKYIQKMASSQTMEYVPKFEIESKL